MTTAAAPWLPAAGSTEPTSARAVPPVALLVLRAVVALTFAGRAFQHLWWDAPVWALAWNQPLLGGIVPALTGMTWNAWATSSTVYAVLVGAIRVAGAAYAVCAVAAVVPARSLRAQRVQGAILLGGATMLLGLAALYCLDGKHQLGVFVEQAAQVVAPAILATVLASSRRTGAPAGAAPSPRLGFVAEEVARAAIGLTFLGHGLYAMGYYEVPGDFVTMVMKGLLVDEGTALLVLKLAGWFDVAVFLGVLLAPRRSHLGAIVLAYASVWGLATAVARVATHLHPVFVGESLLTWTHETAFRLVHGGLPIFLLLVVAQSLQRSKPTDTN